MIESDYLKREARRKAKLRLLQKQLCADCGKRCRGKRCRNCFELQQESAAERVGRARRRAAAQAVWVQRVRDLAPVDALTELCARAGVTAERLFSEVGSRDVSAWGDAEVEAAARLLCMSCATVRTVLTTREGVAGPAGGERAGPAVVVSAPEGERSAHDSTAEQ
jgi:hypothetical protein